MSDDEEDEVCPIKDPKGSVYPWRSTDQVTNIAHSYEDSKEKFTHGAEQIR